MTTFLVLCVIVYLMHQQRKHQPKKPATEFDTLISDQRDTIVKEALAKADVYEQFIHDYLVEQGLDSSSVSPIIERLDQLTVERSKRVHPRKH